MKFKLAAMALLSVAMFCSESNADLLGRMLGRGGCGDCQAAPTCCDTPAPSCGRGCGLNMDIGRPCRLFHGCGDSCSDGCGRAPVRGLFSKVFSGGCGCSAVDILNSGTGDSCGCTAPPTDSCGPTCGCADTNGCGAGLLNRGMFSGGLMSRFSGGCGTGCNSYDAAPVSSCGCDDAPSCGCGMRLNLRGRVTGVLSRVGNLGCGSCGSRTTCGCGTDRTPVRSIAARIPRPFAGGCGCNNAPACGCSSAPAPSCGCDNASNCGCGLKGRVRNVVSHVPRPIKNCRCGRSSCDGGCGSRTGLMNRIRPNNSCDVGCSQVFPNSGCSDCGSSTGGCSTGGCGAGGCGAGVSPMTPCAAPMMSAPHSTNSVVAPTAESVVAPANQDAVAPVADPVAPVAEPVTDEAVDPPSDDIVIPSASDAAPTDDNGAGPSSDDNTSNRISVDPNAFVIGG